MMSDVEMQTRRIPHLKLDRLIAPLMEIKDRSFGDGSLLIKWQVRDERLTSSFFFKVVKMGRTIFDNHKPGKSGVVGVSFNKTHNSWISYITVNKKRIYRYSKSKEAAIENRKLLREEAIKLFWQEGNL